MGPMNAPVPDLIRASATIDGEHLALALVAASEHPEWVAQVVESAPPELLTDALKYLAVDVVGAMLGSS